MRRAIFLPWLALLCILLFSVTANAATYYVNGATGSNSNDGSSGSPWLTIQHAANTAVAGDTVNVLAGTYYETISFPNSGTSGSPITFVGVRSGSIWSTVIDGSIDVGSGWSAVGDGSWTKALGYTAQLMTSNNRNIWRIGDHVTDNTANIWLGQPANATHDPQGYGTVLWWPAIEAIFRTQGANTRVRFRNGENPSIMQVRGAPAGPVVDINGKTWLVFRNFKVQGGQYAVRIRGSSSNITIERNYLTHGRYGLLLDTSSNLTIKNNEITEDQISMMNIGAGDQTSLDISNGQDERVWYHHHYNFNKFEVGNTETDGSRVTFIGTVSNSTFTHNYVHHSIAGLTFYGAISNLDLSYNDIRNHSDNCVYVNGGNHSGNWHHNFFMECDHLTRFQSNQALNTINIYANRYYQPYYTGDPSGGGAKHIFWDTQYGSNGSSQVRVYQNSYAGGGWCCDVGGEGGGQVNLSFVTIRNNLLSSRGMTSYGNVLWTVQNNHSTTTWYNNNGVPTYVLPGGHAGLNSAPSLDGSGYAGMDSAYYVDGQPDYGAVQAGTVPPAGLEAEGGDTTPPTVTLTAPTNGATVSGASVSITATASDDIGVASVQFRRSGADIGSPDTSSPYAVTWDTTAIANGSYALTATACDAASNCTTSDAATVTVNNVGGDTTPPSITLNAPSPGATVSGTSVSLASTQSDNVGITGVQFRVDSQDVGGSQCCTSTEYLWDSTSVADGAHTVAATACDAASNCTLSTVVNITVSNGGDTTPPTVAITAPGQGATVSGATVAISADASDNSGVVAGVQFKRDGANIGAEDTSPPFAVTWDTLGLANGSYALTAVARDVVNNTTTSATITVTVSNNLGSPVISMFAPTAGEIVSGTNVRFYSEQTDNVSIAGVQFHVDGANVGDSQCCLSTEYFWNSTTVSDGWHAVTATACDGASNCTLSAVVNIVVNNTVDTTVPTVAITAPANLSVVSGATVAVTADASDNVIVVGVQFKRGGVNLGTEDTSPPYGITWDTTTQTDGTYDLTAVARDAASNTTISATIAVTVENATVAFLGDATGLSISANPTVIFLSEVSNLGVSASPTATFLGDVSDLSISANSTVTFLGEVTGLSTQ